MTEPEEETTEPEPDGEWVYKPDQLHQCVLPTVWGESGDSIWRCGKCQELWIIEWGASGNKNWSRMTRWQRFKYRKRIQ